MYAFPPFLSLPTPCENVQFRLHFILSVAGGRQQPRSFDLLQRHLKFTFNLQNSKRKIIDFFWKNQIMSPQMILRLFITWYTKDYLFLRGFGIWLSPTSIFFHIFKDYTTYSLIYIYIYIYKLVCMNMNVCKYTKIQQYIDIWHTLLCL